MPDTDGFPAGTPSWVELQTPDVKSSGEFYTKLFGWEIDNLGPDAGGYAIFTKNGKYVAGLGPLTEFPKGWIVHINVDNVDQTAATVQSAGGNLLSEPADVLDVGRMAMLSDPNGGCFTAWQPLRHKGADLVNEPGSFCWTELQTHDEERAKEFYTEVFGWTPATSESQGMSYTEWKIGEKSVAGMMKLPDDADPEIRTFWLVYFMVEDPDAVADKAKRSGGSVFLEPFDIAAGRLAVIGDPDASPLGIIRMN
jgi:hypothetical protein